LLLLFLGYQLVVARRVPATRSRGRRKRAFGLAVVALALAVILGGQFYDLSQLTSDDSRARADVPISVLVGNAKAPKEATQYFARFVVLDYVDSDRPVVLQSGSTTLDFGESEREIPSKTYGSFPGFVVIAGADARSGGRQIHTAVKYDNGSSSSSSGLSGSRPGRFDETYVRYRKQRTMFATFEGRRRGVNVIIVIDPLDAGTTIVEAPFSDVWANVDRARFARDRIDSPNSTRSADNGFAHVLGRLTTFSFVVILLGLIGAAFTMRHSGHGLALYVLIAPFVLMAADSLALQAGIDGLSDDSDVVRREALRTIDDSVFYGRTAREEIVGVSEGDDVPLAKVAARMLAADPISGRTVERRQITGTDAFMSLPR